MKKIVLLGSTGSIGTQTLDIVRNYKDELSCIAVAAMKSVDKIEAQVREFHPEYAVMYDEKAAEELKEKVKDTDTKILSGMNGLTEIATMPESDIVVGAIVGMIGIRPIYEAIEAKKTIALANKETLVCAGHIIMPKARECGVDILPVDSEHSAIFQSLQGNQKSDLEKVLLTASGGPFRGKTRGELAKMTAGEALRHPNWDMGPKVTIDSSTLANKGLEVMEAHWLFDVPYDKIEVLVHPQSVVHSMVQYVDGSVIAQLAIPDMRLPIQYALFYPDRAPLSLPRLDLFSVKDLSFERPDTDTFRALGLALRAAKIGGSMPTVFNAANEAAVRSFLDGKIGYLEIADMIERAMDAHTLIEKPSLEDIEGIARDLA